MTKGKNKGQALTNTSLTASTGALATGGTALMALSMTTDAQAAIVYGTNFEVNGEQQLNEFGSVSAAFLGNSDNGDVFRAFNGLASWKMFDGEGSDTYNGFGGSSSRAGGGLLIGPGGASAGDFSMLASGYSIGAAGGFGPYRGWAGLTDQSGHIGVKFTIGAGTHYGWMHASVDEGGILTIFSWAYEDVPGESIAAGATIPEPGSLSLLALGAAGLMTRRRRKRQ